MRGLIKVCSDAVRRSTSQPFSCQVCSDAVRRSISQPFPCHVRSDAVRRSIMQPFPCLVCSDAVRRSTMQKSLLSPGRWVRRERRLTQRCQGTKDAIPNIRHLPSSKRGYLKTEEMFQNHHARGSGHPVETITYGFPLSAISWTRSREDAEWRFFGQLPCVRVPAEGNLFVF